MIGVVSNPTHRAVVEEFFQLFKTPWEFFRDGRTYEVVVSVTGRVPRTDARAVLIYGTKAQDYDREINIRPSVLVNGGTLQFGGAQLPIYGDLLGFQQKGEEVLRTVDGSRIAGLRLDVSGTTIHRFGYDLFEEVARILSNGQPAENAQSPSLDLHIAIMRQSILDSGVSILEIPPVPPGYDFAVCLTHDIDFVGIRRHKFDHTMWGFLYRATLGGSIDFMRGRLSIRGLLKRFQAAASLPLVYLGFLEDFWMPFEWYLEVEKGLPTTYFLIPFKNRSGEKLATKHAQRRATKYDVTDVRDWVQRLNQQRCEIGVHGIDAWHSAEKGREELDRVVCVSGQAKPGVRMHWLLHDRQTFKVLEQAGYFYDSTAGYNETVGYRCGTHQVFRPLGTCKLLEVPLHIQDGALFFPQQLGLSEDSAWTLCCDLLENARKFGGVLTLLWHDRSFGPERFWGEFYVRFLQTIKSEKVWFATARQTADWFRQRRAVEFFRDDSSPAGTRVRLSSPMSMGIPPLTIRVHQPESASAEDHTWTGNAELKVDNLPSSMKMVSRRLPVETI